MLHKKPENILIDARFQVYLYLLDGDMRYKLGNSGLRVSEICLGTMTFGEKWVLATKYSLNMKNGDINGFGNHRKNYGASSRGQFEAAAS